MPSKSQSVTENQKRLNIASRTDRANCYLHSSPIDAANQPLGITGIPDIVLCPKPEKIADILREIQILIFRKLFQVESGYMKQARESTAIINFGYIRYNRSIFIGKEA